MSVAQLPGPAGVTLAAAVDRFLAVRDLEPSTVDIYRYALERFAGDVGADTPVAHVDEQTVTEHLRGAYGDLRRPHQLRGPLREPVEVDAVAGPSAEQRPRGLVVRTSLGPDPPLLTSR